MSKLYSYTYMSLDGVIDSPEEWSSPFFSDEMAHDLTSRLESAAAWCWGASHTKSSPPSGHGSPMTFPCLFAVSRLEMQRGVSNASPKSPERVGIHSAFDCAMPTTRAPEERVRVIP
jgi:hypothetical protein